MRLWEYNISKVSGSDNSRDLGSYFLIKRSIYYSYLLNMYCLNYEILNYKLLLHIGASKSKPTTRKMAKWQNIKTQKKNLKRGNKWRYRFQAITNLIDICYQQEIMNEQYYVLALYCITKTKINIWAYYYDAKK